MAPIHTNWYVPPRRGSRFSLQHILAATGAAVIIAAGVYAAVSTSMVPSAQNCPARISILVDPSDPLPSDRVVGHLASVIDRSCLGTNVLIGAITSDPTNPLFITSSDFVDPGRADEHWRLFKNRRMAAQERQNQFIDPIATAITATLRRSETPSKSPLIEALASFGNLPQSSKETTHDLTVVVSDLLQNSTCSFVGKSKRRASSLSERCVKVTASHPATLNGEVLIFLVRRQASTGVPQDDDFKRFWTEWLTSAGASTVTWREIS